MVGGSDEPRAVLGLSTAGSTSARDTLGLLVTSVTSNSPAERAGIQEGDRISSVNGVSLRISPDDAGDFEVSNSMSRRLTRELSKLRPGDDVDLRVYSDGRTRTVRIRTADSDSLYTRRRVSRAEIDERPTLGLGIGSTSSRRDTLGVLVMFVDDSGPAARAGIEEGNRIAAIDEIDLRTTRGEAGDEFVGNSKVRRLQREVARLHPGDNVDLRVYANGDFRTMRLRVARAADLPRRRNTFIIGGDGMGMGMGMAPEALRFNVDGAVISEQVRSAIERAMDNAGRALEDIGRGFNRTRIKSQSDDDERSRRIAPIEPIEPIRIEPLEPSRLRRLAPMKAPMRSALLDDSSLSTPVVATALGRERSNEAGTSASIEISGLRMVPVGTELAAYLGKGSERGLLVLDVPQWARTVLRAGDVLLSVDDTPVRPRDGSDEVAVALPRFREAQLDILREGVHHSVTLPARR
jgi:S1-C subfamily serine protease